MARDHRRRRVAVGPRQPQHAAAGIVGVERRATPADTATVPPRTMIRPGRRRVRALRVAPGSSPGSVSRIGPPARAACGTAASASGQLRTAGDVDGRDAGRECVRDRGRRGIAVRACDADRRRRRCGSVRPATRRIADHAGAADDHDALRVEPLELGGGQGGQDSCGRRGPPVRAGTRPPHRRPAHRGSSRRWRRTRPARRARTRPRRRPPPSRSGCCRTGARRGQWMPAAPGRSVQTQDLDRPVRRRDAHPGVGAVVRLVGLQVPVLLVRARLDDVVARPAAC